MDIFKIVGIIFVGLSIVSAISAYIFSKLLSIDGKKIYDDLELYCISICIISLIAAIGIFKTV